MITRLEDLSGIREANQDKSIVLAGGVFDLIHPGHIDLFEIMRRAADISIVTVASDESVQQRKGHSRPIQDQAARLKIVSNMKLVDYALIAPGPNETVEVPMIPVLEALRPDKYISSDPRWNDGNILEGLGVELVPGSRLSEDISTSAMIEKIRASQY